jgi:N-glycosylase/DNA lyase
MSDENRFYELCFVLCAPQAKIGNNHIVNNNLRFMDFYHKRASLEDLTELCKLVRFKNRKAQYLLEAWDQKEEIFRVINLCIKRGLDSTALRLMLVNRLGGMSFKTASQFLRNAYGFQDLAILDVHILRWMEIRKAPTTIDQYLDIERLFQRRAKKYHLSTAELDAILFVKKSNIFWKELR